MLSPLKIIYQDEHYIAIDKPSGIHVHPTYLSKGEDSCMRILRDQIGQRVYTVHRLDRATSGILLFALHPQAVTKVQQLFIEREIDKRYLAIVRGYIPEAGLIDYPLGKDSASPANINSQFPSTSNPPQSPQTDQTEIDQPSSISAKTRYRRLKMVELPYPVGKFPTTRYSLAEVFPLTGRRNQIRRHFAHISHPIIGDVSIGDGKHNRFFRKQFGIRRLLLLAVSLSFVHPYLEAPLELKAELPAEIQNLFSQLDWEESLTLF